MPDRRRLVVAVYDVAPPFEARVRAQLDLLRGIGVQRFALNVVPNWHGDHPLTSAPSLVDLLRSEVTRGSELVLHGLEHRPRGTGRAPWERGVRATFFAGDSAEFVDLTGAEVSRSLEEGVEMLVRVGLPGPTGFSAPGWLLGPAGEAAVREAGLRYLVWMLSVHDLQRSRRHFVPAFGCMGVGPAHEAGVYLLNHLTIAATARTTRAKAYVHPQGDPSGYAFRWTLARIAAMVSRRGWQPATFTELCEDD